MVTTCCLSPWKVAVCFPESSNTNTSSPCRSELRFCSQESNNNDDDFKDDCEDNDDNDFDHLWVGLQHQYNNDDDEKAMMTTFELVCNNSIMMTMKNTKAMTMTMKNTMMTTVVRPPLSWLSRTQQLHEQWAIRVLRCRSALSGDCHEIVWIFMFVMFSGSNCLFLWIFQWIFSPRPPWKVSLLQPPLFRPQRSLETYKLSFSLNEHKISKCIPMRYPNI